MAGPLAPLLAYAQDVILDDYPIVGKSYSVAGDIITAQARVPIWRFTFNLTNPILPWHSNRGLLEDIRQLNTSKTFNLYIGDVDSPNLARITQYQGSMSLIGQNAVTVAAKQVGDQSNVLRLSNVPTGIAFILKKGDFLQPRDATTPVPARANKVYSVLADVPGSALTTAIVTLNRPLLTYPTVGSLLYFGTNVFWTVKIKDLPSFGLGSTAFANITWNSSFNLEEVIS